MLKCRTCLLLGQTFLLHTRGILFHFLVDIGWHSFLSCLQNELFPLPLKNFALLKEERAFNEDRAKCQTAKDTEI